jgi:hypothetical protein
MAWPDNGEVPLIRRRDLGNVHPLGEREDRIISRAERQICVLLD